MQERDDSRPRTVPPARKVEQGTRLKPGEQWIAHDRAGGRAARRRLAQIAKGRIDDRVLAESAKIAAPLLGKELPEPEIREIEARVIAQIRKECGVAEG
jgi:hypothetical protein